MLQGKGVSMSLVADAFGIMVVEWVGVCAEMMW